ncbi:MAG: hypothetical protein HYY06_18355 [Deltaproteobacteria bacterium]|nr:hypothetical protein [Deltaproteobacteria bacterium]
MEHPVTLSELPPAVVTAVGPSAAGPAKMMAARGLAPLGPADLVAALYLLSFDADAKLQAAATGSLGKLPEKILLPALDAVAVPHVLDFVATRLSGNEGAVERIVLNPRTADETLQRIASSAGERITELIATNEARLLQVPAIIEALYLNKSTRMSTATRLVELAARNGVVLSGIDAYKEIAAGVGQELIPEPSGEPLPSDLDFAQAQADGADDVDVIRSKEGEEEGDEEVAAKYVPLHYKLQHMSISEKIRMAQIGTAAHRALLVRDPNRLVHMSVIRSPSLNEREVEGFVKNRGTPEEVIRFVTTRREWLRPYSIKHALVANPKTPIQAALHLLVHLRIGDLKGLARSKNVAAPVAQGARELIKKKSGGGG